MTKALGYVRRSTDRQEESLDQQRAKLDTFAKGQGWELVDVFADDAISGSELSRPGLDQLLSEAAARDDVQAVITWDRNRLARPKMRSMACCWSAAWRTPASAWCMRPTVKKRAAGLPMASSATSSIIRTATICVSSAATPSGASCIACAQANGRAGRFPLVMTG